MSFKILKRRIYQSIYRNEILSPENQERRRLLSEAFFDTDGNILDETVCNDNGQPEQSTSNIYKDSHLIEATTTDLLNEISEVQKFEYNEAGLLASKTLCFGDGSEMKTIYEYDDKKRLIRRIESDPEEETSQEKVYTYNGDLLMSVIETDNDGNTLESITYDYDENGRQITTTAGVGEEEGVSKMEYDEHNRPVVQRIYNTRNQLIARTTWEYEGNTVRETVENNQGIVITETENDEAGQEIARTRMTKGGQILEQLTFALHPDGRPDRTTGTRYTPAYDTFRFFSLDYEYELAE
ncbi:MAG TPA: hypothetical protein DEO70_12810 [Bacteroidales bacterium]|nr:MAG: hypothetical protein A2X11_07690 [Bacteroidetes bacterium GWE2_42_24]PKP25672.1 MAG: hypothetical protein CVU06_04020 [Bacteroidetes bacterium HGW-Bacteroidetes-22]HBZ67709.1 hypothetical protein [Bacteroidales bacterium]